MANRSSETDDRYDFIIVGAGSAGCVLANRLSADPAVRVLLIEAGGSDRNPLLRAPGGVMALLRHGWYLWPYETAPQAQFDQRVIACPRGKVLGGSSSINGMIYDRGSPDDYDSWSRAGNRGWSYRELLPYFKKLETYAPARTAYHGSDGPIHVTRPDPMNPLSSAWIEAAVQAGFRYNEDTNGENREGAGPVDATIDRGRRSSTSTAYLRPAMGRSNLVVVTRGHATRIRFDGTRAVGVDYVRGGAARQAVARSEIILSAGAINSPHLLMLSGVGSEEELSRHGIETRIRLEGVGRNLNEHPVAAVVHAAIQPVALNRYAHPIAGAGALARYLLFSKGPLAGASLEATVLARSSPDLTHPDLKLSLVPALADYATGLSRQHGFLAYIENVRPKSSGRVKLVSSDPMAAPLIDLNLLDSEVDRKALREGVRLARRLFSQPAFKAFRGEEMAPGPQVSNEDEDLDAYIKASGTTDLHSAGTCKMGRDELAVVDEELRVRGAQGLRVVDASIMPHIVSGNTNIPTIMIAEKASDLILGSKAVEA